MNALGTLDITVDVRGGDYMGGFYSIIVVHIGPKKLTS